MSAPSRIVFLDVPASLKEDIMQFMQNRMPEEEPNEDDPNEDEDPLAPEKNPINTNFFDESIPIPVEIEATSKHNLPLEMILSAMIKVVSSPGEYGVEARHVDYYRNFVLTLKPEIFNELNGAAIIKARNGDFDMALEIITMLEALFPGAPLLLLNRALILEDKAENHSGQDGSELDAKVLEAYEKALAIEPALPEALFNSGFFFLRRREYRRARECFSDYLSMTEQAHNTEQNEKREKVLAVVKDIEDRGLDDSDFMEAVALIRSGEAGEGLFRIKAFLEKRPLVWNGWFVLGWALRIQGRWQDSIDSFKKAVDLGGGNIDTRNEMAICYMELGDLPAAEKELEKALKDEPENTKTISNLGVVALKSGDEQLAAAYFRTVLELDPGDMIALNFFENR